MKYNIIRHRIYSSLHLLQLWSDETSQSKSVQEVQQSAAFVPHHAHLLSSKTHNDEQGSDKRKLMSLSLSLDALVGCWCIVGRMSAAESGFSPKLGFILFGENSGILTN